MRLEGKVALITGGARGIGAATANLFAQEGAGVVIGDILDEGHRVETRIKEGGHQGLFVKMDVTSEADWDQAVEAAITNFGKLNVLVNNAGISGARWQNALTREAWNKIMEVNSTGAFLGTRVAIPLMRRAGGGSIVNISSQMGIVGAELSHPAYNASKGAIRTFTKAIAIQYAQHHIRCNSVHPGPIASPENAERRRDPAYMANVSSKVPLGRFGLPEEVASAILFLASDESSYITGAELIIDGGWLAQ